MIFVKSSCSTEVCQSALGGKKGEYIKLEMYYTGLEEYLDRNDLERIKEEKEEKEVKDWQIEKKIAQRLGFKSDSSKEFKLFREEVRADLSKFGFR